MIQNRTAMCVHCFVYLDTAVVDNLFYTHLYSVHSFSHRIVH